MDLQQDRATSPAPEDPTPPQQPAPRQQARRASDPSRAWLPELVRRFADCLAPNEVACTLRLVNKAAAAQLNRPQDRTVRLSLPAPHAAFLRRWAGLDAMRCLTRKQREQLPCLVARSGSIANLEVLLARVGAAQVLRAEVLAAAAAGGQLEVCRWLRARGCPYSGAALSKAARAGQRATFLQLFADGCPLEDCGDKAAKAAAGGHVGLMDWLLRMEPKCPDSSVRALLQGAALGCDLPTLQRLHHTYMGDRRGELVGQKEATLLTYAAGSLTADWRAKVEWLEGRGYARTAWGCVLAALGPDARPRLEWLRQRGYPFAPVVARAACRCADAGALQLLQDSGVLLDMRAVCIRLSAAARAGRVADLEALGRAALKPGVDLAGAFRSSAEVAALCGRLGVLEWLVESQGAAGVLTVTVFEAAAKSGSVEPLAWLRARGCAWGASVLAAAAQEGSAEQLEWLVAHGCPNGDRV